MYTQKSRIVVAILLCLVMLISIGSTTIQASTKYNPGSYKGSANGYNGAVEVEVTVSEEQITDINVLRHTETSGIGTVAIEQLPSQILAAQSLRLDAVSGCTSSSTAIFKAVEQALTLAGASPEVIFAPPITSQSSSLQDPEELTVDVLIVGAGASGLAAALSSHENGVKDILVIEKMPIVGGASSTAGGGMQAFREDKDPEITEKNIEELFLYWNRTGKFTNNARLTMLAARLSTPTLKWLEKQGVELTLTIKEDQPTIHAGSPGRAAGIINTLYKNVQDAGIPVRLQTRAQHLIIENGKVIGVEATGDKGQPMIIKAKAVLLATGGYGNNPDLIPDTLSNVIYYGPVAPTGDGHLMVKEIGVPLFNMDKVAVKHFGIETSPGFGIHIHWAVAKLFNSTGSFAVSKEGVRVVNEGGDEMDIALASMHQSSDGRLYIVMDQASYDVFSDVLIQYKAFTNEQLEQFISENGSGITKLVKNANIAGAAEAIGLDPTALQSAVNDFNAGVSEGKDAFKRSFTAPFGDGPYYIMQTIPRFATSLGGVNVTDNLQVLDVEEQPVPGLFAAGEIVGNVNGSYAHYLIWCFGAGLHFGKVVSNYLK